MGSLKKISLDPFRLQIFAFANSLCEFCEMALMRVVSENPTRDGVKCTPVPKTSLTKISQNKPQAVLDVQKLSSSRHGPKLDLLYQKNIFLIKVSQVRMI